MLEVKPLLYQFDDLQCKAVYFPDGKVYTNFSWNSTNSVFYENWPNGKLRYIEYRTSDKMGNGDKPAKIGYYSDGTIASISYYADGKLHREDGPAWKKFSIDGILLKSEFWTHGMVKDGA